MPKKRSKTQERLEARVLVKHNGKIDLAQLWEEEADPKKIEELRKHAEIQNN